MKHHQTPGAPLLLTAWLALLLVPSQGLAAYTPSTHPGSDGPGTILTPAERVDPPGQVPTAPGIGSGAGSHLSNLSNPATARWSSPGSASASDHPIDEGAPK
jgi:hypothetical protein